ncbi:unnamed protein product, partial [Ilex paraguariensis]
MADRVVNTGEGTAETRPGFKDKGGSLFPKKQKSVKTMIGERIGQSVDSAINNFKDKKKIKP